MLSDKQQSEKLSVILQAARKKTGLTMREAGERLLAVGFSSSNHVIVNKVENNKRRVDIVEFTQFCKAYEIDPIETLATLIKAIEE